MGSYKELAKGEMGNSNSSQYQVADSQTWRKEEQPGIIGGLRWQGGIPTLSSVRIGKGMLPTQVKNILAKSKQGKAHESGRESSAKLYT